MKRNNDATTLKKSINWKKLIFYGLLIGFVVLVILFLITLHWISSDVRAICKKSQQQFKGDCVEALVATLKSDIVSIKEKNQVIWALGEIGDKRALPILKKLYTGADCQKPCDTSKYICQYGIEKAIRGCDGFNFVRHVWQWI